MCGIAGIVSSSAEGVRRALGAMIQAQRHRGPDDTGQEFHAVGEQHLGLGHTRLSIIDLSPSGHQPMTHPVTGDQIIFNGEIYNFQSLRVELEARGESFSGHSDTEVLLHGLSLAGPAFLKRLAGMYALAFYQAGSGRLLLARDPLGIKPLYVAQDGANLLLASEVRAILATGLVSRELDLAGLAAMLAFGAVQHPTTLFRAIRSFPPGCYQEWDSRTGAGPVVSFWEFPAPRGDVDEEEAVEEVRRLLDQSVREHLVADVPVGVFLSSGLDSTAIAALAARHHPRMRSFTVGFADQPDMSEAALARQTAVLLGLDHTDLQITGSEALAAAEAWLRSLDQPSVDGLNVYVISQAVRRCGITVALSGQGGDELFGGYPTFTDVPRLASWVRRFRWVPRPVRGLAGHVLSLRQPAIYRRKMCDILRSDGSIRQLYFLRRRAMLDQRLTSFGIDPAALGLDRDLQPPCDLPTVHIDESDPVWTISQLESRYYQGNMLLRDTDVNGMAHSLEIRVPYLDQRLVDYVYGLSGALRKPSGSVGKHLLGRAMAEHFRPALLQQGKRGFTLPIRRWMLGPLRDLCEEAIGGLKKSGLLRAKGVEAVWTSFLAEPESPIWTRAFTLCVLQTYLQGTGAV